MDAAFFDADRDGDLDLYVVAGGNEFSRDDPPLQDRLYLNNGGQFSKAPLPTLPGNKSCVRPADVDGDGDLDLFVGGRVVPNHYGQTPDSYLLINDGHARFSARTDALAPGLRLVGMTTDAVWTDLNNDHQPDLIVTGDWMVPRVFLNKKGHLQELEAPFGETPMHGLWQCIVALDVDNDGDMDLVAGNLGLNTKLRKSHNGQLRMWVKDIDNNQTSETILAYNRGDNLDDWFPVATKDELGKQMPGVINKRYVPYSSIAGKTVAQIFTADDLADAQVKQVDQFASVLLLNDGTNGKVHFTVQPLPLLAQVSKLFALCPADIDGDGDLDVLGGGNFYGVAPYQGRYDASYGLVLRNDKGTFTALSPVETGFLLHGEVRSIVVVRGRRGRFVLVGRNNDRAVVYNP